MQVSYDIFITTAIFQKYLRSEFRSPHCYGLLNQDERLIFDQNLVSACSLYKLKFGYKRVCLPIDFSSFDKTFGLDAQIQVYKFVQQSAISKGHYAISRVIDEIIWQMNHTYVTAYQTFSFQFLSGMPSGIKTTNDVESIVNAAMLM